MDINNLYLSPRLLHDLYKNSLIEPLPATSFEKEFPFLGKNKKNILILSAEEQGNPDEGFVFLKSILAACKLSMDDAAFINEKGSVPVFTYSFFNHYFHPKVVLLFNIPPSDIDLPIHFPHFQIQPWDSCTFLSAPSLAEIEKDKSLKSKLWNCLKNIFVL